ncbi:hypothetical protein BX070DRAFT_232298 [Coemansia spiralis]|nr:hypothetical protein BX070DRAFT_232298 [Coemansia spiralis]
MSTFKAEAKKIATASPSNDSRHEEEKVWYLGYGSNMSSKVLSGRRQVFPVESLPVVVKGYQLTFDMAGLPYWEPGFGTIQPVNTKSNSADHIIADGLDSTDASKRRLLDGIARNEYSAKEGERMPDCQAGSPLHCIAHLITRKEMDHIINTEGGNGHPDFGYQVVEVECQTYDGKPITGVTLIDKDTRLTRRHPSARYHKILLDGAAEHGLSPEYIERLAAIMPYTASTFGQKTGKWAMLVIGLPLALPVIISSMAALIFKVKVPLIMAAYGEWTKRVLWTLHDYVFAPIFGAGC